MTRRHLSLLLAVLALALAWRLVVCVRTDWALDSDEAIVGRMALHIGQGRELPVWYYGQPYMGALEAYAAALPVRCLGTTGVPLRLTAIAFALLFVGLSTELARRILGTPAAVATGVYLALAPLTFAVWTVKLRGGYVSLYALGALAFLLAHAIVERGATTRRCLALGVVAGLATWLNLLAFPFLAAAGLYLLSRRRLFCEGRALLACVAGALLGSAPFWAANLASGGATFRYLFGLGAESEAQVRFVVPGRLFKLLGAHPPWPTDLDLSWRFAVVLVFAAALVAFLVRERHSLLRAATASREPTSGSELYVLHALLYLLVAGLTSFGADPTPRYASLLYMTVAPVFGVGFAVLWSRRGAARTCGVIALVGLAAFNAATVLEHEADVENPGRAGAFKAIRGSVDLTGVYRRLEQEGLGVVAVDAWSGPRFVYETNERVTALPTRYAPDLDVARVAERRAIGVFERGKDPGRISPFLESLPDLGLTTRTFEVGGYTFHELLDAGLASRDMRVTSDGGDPDALMLAFDRDPRSRFVAEGPTRISIDLGELVQLDSISAYFTPAARPRKVTLRASADGETWTELTQATRVAPALRVEVGRGAGTRARYLQVTGTGKTWALVELFVFPR